MNPSLSVVAGVLAFSIVGCRAGPGLEGEDESLVATAARATAVRVCPGAAPREGDPCDGTLSPVECEYGGDGLGRCRTLALCFVAGDAGTSRWSLRTDPTCLGQNPPLCPPTFGARGEGSACPAPGALACEYDEGRCACACRGATSEWRCRRRDAVPSQVNRVPRPPQLPSCPPVRPAAGSPCPVADQSCAYATQCTPQLSLGWSLRCVDDVWVVEGGGVFCIPQRCAAAPNGVGDGG